jgi:hypothetical protein
VVARRASGIPGLVGLVVECRGSAGKVIAISKHNFLTTIETGFMVFFHHKSEKGEHKMMQLMLTSSHWHHC